jgi:hypothetical protein
MQPIPPHASKEECDALVRDDLIFGCGRPLQIIEKDVGTDSPGSAYNVIICDYIWNNKIDTDINIFLEMI